jgi:DnaJ-class molecular chaperone
MAAGDTLEAECERCDGEGWILVRRVLTPSSPSQLFEENCPDCNGTGWIACDKGGVDCPFPTHCYCESAWERQQADNASEPPMSADERHQQAWRERQALRGGYSL